MKGGILEHKYPLNKCSCGENPEFIWHYIKGTANKIHYFIRCPVCRKSTQNRKRELGAVNEWNEINKMNETEITEKWFSEMIKPEKDKYVIVKDDKGKEYENYTWNGHCWYEWIIDDDGADGYPNRDVNICVWRYQD